MAAKSTRGLPQQVAGTWPFAEPGHGDAPQGKRRWVVAQCDKAQRAEYVTGGEGATGGTDKGVHTEGVSVMPARYILLHPFGFVLPQEH